MVTVLSILFLLLLIIFAIRQWWKTTIYGKASEILKNYPGPPTFPLFGNTLQLKTEFPELLKQIFTWYQIYGSPMRLKIGPFTAVIVFEANHVEAVLKNMRNISKSRDYDMLADWLGRGLLISTGQRWFRKRKLLTPAFHFQILKDFVPIYNEQAEKLVKILKPKAESGQAFDICPLLSLCTLDIICETAMGKRLNAMENANCDYVNAIMKISPIIMKRTMKPWLWPDVIFHNFSSNGRQMKEYLKILHEFTWNVIREHEAENKVNGRSVEQEVLAEEQFGKKRKRMAFLDLLLQVKQNGEMDLEAIREEVDTFMFEGHDTTATGLMWTCYCLGRNPEIQRKVQEELDSILGKHLSVSPGPEHLSEMKYLECCIKESHRLYPPVPVIARKIEESLKIDETHTLPPGTVVNVQFFGLHRDPKYFPDPLRFDPDRFLSENSASRHPFAFVPFSAGPRNCIGQKFAMMEEKVILCHLLKNFTIEALEPEESIDPAVLLVLRPAKGVNVILTPRYGTN